MEEILRGENKWRAPGRVHGFIRKSYGKVEVTIGDKTTVNLPDNCKCFFYTQLLC